MSSANYQSEIIIQLRKEIDRVGHVLRASQSAALENQAEVFRLRAEIERLRQALENAQQARVLQGKAIIDADKEILRLRAAAGPLVVVRE